MSLHDKRFPNEPDEYRAARDELLRAEHDLRRRIEQVAAMRRALPPGGPVADDYAFEREGPDGGVETVRMSELFTAGRDTLVVYSYMFEPRRGNPGFPFGEGPCPMCTSLIDGLDAQAPHVRDRVELVVAASAPIGEMTAFGRERGWRHVPLISSAGSTYDADYLAQSPEGAAMPMLNVFVRGDDGVVRHHWGSELLFAPDEEQQPRHVDMLWPLWNVLDLTPAGRGTDWYPRLTY